MQDPKMPEKRDPDNQEDQLAYDLEIETEPDTDEIMREAVEAVESHLRDDSGGPIRGSETDARAERSIAVADEDDEAPRTDMPLGGLELKLRDADERAMRALADYENFRRRVDRERLDYARYAAERALSEFLPVVDNLGRALEAGGDPADLRKGVEMIYRQMEEVLHRLHVTPVASVGEGFDPSVHEAVSKQESEDFAHPTVMEEYQRGYLLHDRLLRPAMVRVGVPTDSAAISKKLSQDDDSGEDV